MAHFFVSGSATTYWIEKVRGSKKPVTSGLAVMDYPLALFRRRDDGRFRVWSCGEGDRVLATFFRPPTSINPNAGPENPACRFRDNEKAGSPARLRPFLLSMARSAGSASANQPRR